MTTLPAQPRGSIDRLAAGARRPSGMLLGVLFLAWLAAVWLAPEDRIQGVIQKILYVHVPCAFAAYAGFLLTAAGGALYLWRRDEAWDRFAASAAEVGVLFCALVIVTGPIWAKGTWGRWWSWDPRLTITTLLFLVYVAYLLLRSFTEGEERAARFAAVYGIAGLAVVPLNYFAIDLFGGASIHPENLQRGSLGEGMGWPFLLGVLTALVAVVHLVSVRLELAALRTQAARRDAAFDSLAEGAPTWDT